MNNLGLNVLFYDSSAEERARIASTLTASGYLVETFSSKEEIFNATSYGLSQVIILEDEEFENDRILERLKVLNSQAQIILLSNQVSKERVLKAIRLGAFDLLVRPIKEDQVVLTLARLEEHLRVVDENRQLREEVEHEFSFAGAVSHNSEMKQVFETVKRLASYSSTVLITGESGTGKELVAHAIHLNSNRKKFPFVAVNCGAIPENLIESELFGHKKGAFTDAVRDKKGLLEEASQGTLFLDEVGEMPALLQVKLLRALQEKYIRPIGEEKSIPIDTRIIAATNRNLEEDVKSGSFREDLFYRLNVVNIKLPALRDRKEDLHVLSDFLINKMSKKLAVSPKKVSAAVLAKFSEYNWPGNIRELENYLERALLLSKGEVLILEDFPQDLISFQAQTAQLSSFSNNSLSIKLHAEQLEVRLIKEALIRTNGNRTQAARLLEISHRALLYKLKDYNLTDFLK